MLIRLSDLEPGDVIRFTEEICELYRETAPVFYNYSHNVDLVINYVAVFYDDDNIQKITIKFSNYNWFKSMTINEDGRCWGNTCPIFEIVKLKDE